MHKLKIFISIRYFSGSKSIRSD